MKLKQKIQQIINQPKSLSNDKTQPIGLDPFYDLKYRFKNYDFKIFFDVGANIGQSTNYIKSNFPSAKIWCFEPFRETFEILKKNIPYPDIFYHQIALGAENKEVTANINPIKELNSLINYNNVYKSSKESENIIICTLDFFCSKFSIDRIDYLKIDTEGYDLEVLKGSIGFLKNQFASFVEVEVGMNPENKFHVSFEEVKHFMEKLEYRIYGIYDQVHEWPTKTPILRRANLLFISKACYDRSNNGN